MATRAKLARQRGLLCDPSVSDQELLFAVVNHYMATRTTSLRAQEFLESINISEYVADELMIGYSNRSLGLTIPEANRVAGATLRRRLAEMGIFKSSGHERFYGSLVVPVLQRGVIVAMCGIPLGKTRSSEYFADGLQGGTFSWDIENKEPVVCESIAKALIEIGKNNSVVVATYSAVTTHDGIGATSEDGSGEITAVDRQFPCIDIKDDKEGHVVFSNRSFRIRGAGKDNSHGSLVVNLSVTDTTTGKMHIDTLDLYLARQREAFVSSVVRHLHANPDELSYEIQEVIEVAERTSKSPADEEDDSMSQARYERAMEFLMDENLLSRVANDLCALGVIGEEKNASILYLAATSRLSNRPLGVVVQSSSSSGKTTLAEAVLSLMPASKVVSLSAMSKQALYYLGPDALSHKVLFVAEDQGAKKASYALKLLQSEGKVSIASASKDATTGKIATSTYEVLGPVSLIMTTTAMDIDEELANRLISVGTREDVDQTRAVISAQREALSKDALLGDDNRSEIISLHQDAQRLLKPALVVVNDPTTLNFNEATTRARRDHQKYLSLICASALLHQYQRTRSSCEINGRVIDYIEADKTDVFVADTLSYQVLVRDGCDLPARTREILDELHAFARHEPFTKRGAREALGIQDTQLKVHLARLVDYEYATVSRNGSQSWYSLCWEPASNTLGVGGVGGAPARRANPTKKAGHIKALDTKGSKQTQPGGGRGVVGGKTGGGRTPKKAPNAEAETAICYPNTPGELNRAVQVQGIVDVDPVTKAL